MENMHKTAALKLNVLKARLMLEKSGYKPDDIARRFFPGKLDASSIRFQLVQDESGISEKMEITLAEGRMGTKLLLENGELYRVTRAYGFENFCHVDKHWGAGGNPVFELPKLEPAMGAKASGVPGKPTPLSAAISGSIGTDIDNALSGCAALDKVVNDALKNGTLVNRVKISPGQAQDSKEEHKHISPE